jgi:hypothetical protein
MKKLKIFLLSATAYVAASIAVFFYDTGEMVGRLAEKCEEKAEHLTS